MNGIPFAGKFRFYIQVFQILQLIEKCFRLVGTAGYFKCYIFEIHSVQFFNLVIVFKPIDLFLTIIRIVYFKFFRGYQFEKVRFFNAPAGDIPIGLYQTGLPKVCASVIADNNQSAVIKSYDFSWLKMGRPAVPPGSPSSWMNSLVLFGFIRHA